MTLAQLEVLLQVAESGSFTGAATALGMTQSGVSRAVGSLESELGISLLHRGRNGVEPTEAGDRVLVHARDLLSRAETIRQEAAAFAGVARGRVRVGSIWSLAARLLPGILAELGRRYPGVEVSLLEGTDPEVEEWVSTGVVDAGLLAGPCSGLESRPLARDAMVALVPPGHELAERPAVGVKDLARFPFILSKAGCEPMIRKLFRRENLAPAVQFEAHEVTTVLGMVELGLGVTIVPELAIPEGDRRLHRVPLDPPAHRELAVAVRSLERISPAVEAFLRVAEERATRWARGREEPAQGSSGSA